MKKQSMQDVFYIESKANFIIDLHLLYKLIHDYLYKDSGYIFQGNFLKKIGTVCDMLKEKSITLFNRCEQYLVKGFLDHIISIQKILWENLSELERIKIGHEYDIKWATVMLDTIYHDFVEVIKLDGKYFKYAARFGFRI